MINILSFICNSSCNKNFLVVWSQNRLIAVVDDVDADDVDDTRNFGVVRMVTI